MGPSSASHSETAPMSDFGLYLSLYFWVAALILLLGPATNREDAVSALLWPWSALVYLTAIVVVLGLGLLGLGLVLAGLSTRMWRRVRKIGGSV